MTYDEIKKVQKRYLAGTRVQLNLSDNNSIKEQNIQKGTVTHVDDQGLIHINMDNGMISTINPELDRIKFLDIDDQILEAEELKHSLLNPQNRHRNNERDNQERE